MYKTSRRETPFDPSIPERPGWEGMHVHWLADRDHGRTETTVFNITEFPPNRWHELHRHASAEEYFQVSAPHLLMIRASSTSEVIVPRAAKLSSST